MSALLGMLHSAPVTAGLRKSGAVEDPIYRRVGAVYQRGRQTRGETSGVTRQNSPSGRAVAYGVRIAPSLTSVEPLVLVYWKPMRFSASLQKRRRRVA